MWTKTKGEREAILLVGQYKHLRDLGYCGSQSSKYKKAIPFYHNKRDMSSENAIGVASSRFHFPSLAFLNQRQLFLYI